MKNDYSNDVTVTKEVFEVFKAIFFKYVHDKTTFLQFYFYVQDFVVMVRQFMDEMAREYKIKNHLYEGGQRLGESRGTIYNATKTDLGYPQ
jgi:hypothetical protein